MSKEPRDIEDEESEVTMPAISFPLTQDQAIDALIQTRKLTPDIVDGLGLKPNAVRTWGELPFETREGMVDALIDRFLGPR